MHILSSDLRYALRMLRRRPAFTIAALAALSLGLGANAAMFSVIDAVLLRPLPYERVEELVTLRQIDRAGDATQPGDVAPPTYLDWRDAAQSYAAIAATRPWSFTDATTGEPEVFPAGLVSPGFFELLGVRAATGRVLTDQDYQQGRSNVAVISDGLWRRRYGADPAVVGRTVRFSTGPVTIVGVLPAQFRWLERDQVIWAPYVLTERARQLRRQQTFLRAVARLKPGITAEAAGAEADVVRQRLAETYPDAYRTVDLRVVPVETEMLGRVRPALLVLFGAVGLILVIACANVAGLMLARSAERQREFSVRVAIGAGPGRVARQLLVESLLLAALGSAAGLLLAYWSLGTIVWMTPGDVPRLDQTTLNWRVVAFSSALAVAVAALVGLGPALHARHDLMPALRGATLTGRGRSTRLRQWFIGAEVAVTVILLIGAALLVQSFLRLTRVDPGFTGHNVITLETLIWSALPKPDQQRVFFNEALERIRALPGVAAAGGVTALPFLGERSIEMEASVAVVGAVDRTASSTAWLSIATTGYFETMGVSVLQGRTFTQHDDPGAAPVAIVSEGFARAHLGANPLGRSIVVSNDRTPTPLQVIGVVRAVRHLGLDSATRDEVFVPLDQVPFGSLSLVVRTAEDPYVLLPSVKAAIRQVYPQQTFGTVALLDELVGATVAPRRFYLGLAVVLAAVGLVLAMVGLYGVMSLLAAQRTREIGVRIALGGTKRHILQLVLRSGLMAPVIGVALGAVGALASSQVLRAYLFGIEPSDPGTFVAVAALLLIVSLLAAYLPARRALRIDPVVTLREE